MKFRVHNGNFDKTYNADTAQEAVEMFAKENPDEARNTIFVDPIKEQ